MKSISLVDTRTTKTDGGNDYQVMYYGDLRLEGELTTVSSPNYTTVDKTDAAVALSNGDSHVHMNAWRADFKVKSTGFTVNTADTSLVFRPDVLCANIDSLNAIPPDADIIVAGAGNLTGRKEDYLYLYTMSANGTQLRLKTDQEGTWTWVEDENYTGVPIEANGVSKLDAGNWTPLDVTDSFTIEHKESLNDRQSITKVDAGQDIYFELKNGNKVRENFDNDLTKLVKIGEDSVECTVQECTQFPDIGLRVNIAPVLLGLTAVEQGTGVSTDATQLRVLGFQDGDKVTENAETFYKAKIDHDDGKVGFGSTGSYFTATNDITNPDTEIAAGTPLNPTAADRFILFHNVNADQLTELQTNFPRVYFGNGDNHGVKGSWLEMKTSGGSSASQIGHGKGDVLRFDLDDGEELPTSLATDDAVTLRPRFEKVKADHQENGKQGIPMSGSARVLTGVDLFENDVNVPKKVIVKLGTQSTDTLDLDSFVDDTQTPNVLNDTAHTFTIEGGNTTDKILTAIHATAFDNFMHHAKIRLNPGKAGAEWWRGSSDGSDRFEVHAIAVADITEDLLANSDVVQEKNAFTNAADKQLDITVPPPLDKHGATEAKMASNSLYVYDYEANRLAGDLMVQGQCRSLDGPAGGDAQWNDQGYGYDARFDIPKGFIGGHTVVDGVAQPTITPSAEAYRSEGMGQVLKISVLSNGEGYINPPSFEGAGGQFATIESPAIARGVAAHTDTLTLDSTDTSKCTIAGDINNVSVGMHVVSDTLGSLNVTISAINGNVITLNRTLTPKASNGTILLEHTNVKFFKSLTADSDATANCQLGMNDDPAINLHKSAYLDLRPLKQALSYHAQSYTNLTTDELDSAAFLAGGIYEGVPPNVFNGKIYKDGDFELEGATVKGSGVGGTVTHYDLGTEKTTHIAGEFFENTDKGGAAGHTWTEKIDYNVLLGTQSGLSSAPADLQAFMPAHYRRYDLFRSGTNAPSVGAFTDSLGRDECDFWRNALNQIAVAIKSNGVAPFYSPYNQGFTLLNAVNFHTSLTQSGERDSTTYRKQVQALSTEANSQTNAMDSNMSKNRECAIASWNRVVDGLPDILTGPNASHPDRVQMVAGGDGSAVVPQLIYGSNPDGNEIGPSGHGADALTTNWGKLKIQHNEETRKSLEALLDRMAAENRFSDTLKYDAVVGSDYSVNQQACLAMSDNRLSGSQRQQDTLHITMTVSLHSAESSSSALSAVNPASNELRYPTNYLREADRDETTGDLNISPGAGKIRVRFKIKQDATRQCNTVYGKAAGFEQRSDNTIQNNNNNNN